MDIHQRLADNISQLMKRRGMDAAALARAAKVSPNTIHNASKQRYSISLSSLAKIARALGVDASELLSPTAKLDPDMAVEVGQLMDDYRRADADGRKTIRKVAEAQASYVAHSPTRPDDDSAG